MYEVLPLSVLARTLSVQALLTLRDVDVQVSSYLVAALRTDHYVSVSEPILKQIVEQFPSRVRGDLVKVLVPPHVRELSIRKCIGVSVSSMLEILTRCSHIERLDVSECDQLMRVQFFQHVLPSAAPNLTSLIAENCKVITDASVKCILKNNSGLKQLNISMCDKITDHAFLLDERLQLSRETNIKVHGHDRHGYLCQLTHIDVSGCRNLTSSGIRFLTTLCGPTLQHVNISYTEVDSTALWYLSGYGLTSAVHMAVSYMMEINQDEVGSEQLAELVKYMREVSLGPDDDVSDDLTDENDEEKEQEEEQVCDIDEPRNNDVKVEEDAVKTVASKKVDDISKDGAKKDIDLENDIVKLDESEKVDIAKDCLGVARTETLVKDGAKNDQGGEPDIVILDKAEHSTVAEEEVIDIVEGIQIESDKDIVTRDRKGKEESNIEEDKGTDDCKSSCDSLSCASELQAPVFDVELIPILDVQFHKCNCQVHEEETRTKADVQTLPDIQIQVCESEPGTSTQSCPACQPTSPILLQRCGYGHSSESGSSYRPPSGKSSICEDYDADDVFDICTPVNLLDNGANPEPQGACEGAEMPLESIVDRLEMATLATNALVAGCSAWQEAQTVPSSAIKQSLKPDSSVEYQNETLTLPKPYKPPKLPASAKKSFANLLQIYEPNIRVLDISHIAFNSKQLVHSCLKTFFQRNKHVQQLHLAWKGLTDEMLTFIAEHSPELSTLSLIDCDSLSSEGVAYLIHCCPKLCRLNLRGVCFITDPALMPAPPANLTALNIAETNFTDEALALLAQHNAHSLSELDLSWCEEMMLEHVPGLNALLTRCTGLQSLLLRHLMPIPNATLDLLVDRCTGLRELNLSSVGNLMDQHLVTMAVRMARLVKLDVSWNPMVSDAGVRAILERCVHLQELCVAGVKKLTSAPFLPIISDVTQLRRSQALLRLKLQESKVLEEDEHFSSDEEFESLHLPARSLVYAPCLKWLDAEYCDHVEDRHLAELVGVCRGSLRARDYYGQNVVAASWVQSRQNVFDSDGNVLLF